MPAGHRQGGSDGKPVIPPMCGTGWYRMIARCDVAEPWVMLSGWVWWSRAFP
jgi:hypothetical protein